MNRLLKGIVLAMATLYWPGTNDPILQYQTARVVCGEFTGVHGRINYTWADGSVDLTRFGFIHYFIEDYRCLRRDK